jgi:hypothetical protein
MRGKTDYKACGNCKEIPPHNYVLHTAHCARNITLCHLCTEPIPKNQNQFESHKEACPYAVAKQKKKPPPPSPIKLELSSYYREQKAIQDKKAAARKERLIRKYDRMLDPGYKLGSGKPREKCLVCWNFKDDLSHFLGLCLPKDCKLSRLFKLAAQTLGADWSMSTKRTRLFCSVKTFNMSFITL